MGAFLSSSTIFCSKTLDVERCEAHSGPMTHPLADLVQPLIDQWLASDEGVIAEYEFELGRELLAS